MGAEEKAGNSGPAGDHMAESVAVRLVGIWATSEIPDLARDIARTALADYRGRTTTP